MGPESCITAKVGALPDAGHNAPQYLVVLKCATCSQCHTGDRCICDVCRNSRFSRDQACDVAEQ